MDLRHSFIRGLLCLLYSRGGAVVAMAMFASRRLLAFLGRNRARLLLFAID